jgi:hypothetical protein
MQLVSAVHFVAVVIRNRNISELAFISPTDMLLNNEIKQDSVRCFVIVSKETKLKTGVI